MGCCQARNLKSEENYYTSVLNFLETKDLENNYDLDNKIDMIIFRYLQQNMKNQTNSQDAHDAESNN
jgi:hypothetical protein